jgi:MerR family transcriptional regulator, light-induced transcriptional regulator
LNFRGIICFNRLKSNSNYLHQTMSTSKIASNLAPTPSLRSAAVARMAGIPVATLRIWEQRYQAVQPATTQAKHRLYTPQDVGRVMLLRQLTQQGHSISALAGLDGAKLQQLSSAVNIKPAPSSARRLASSAKSLMRIAVIGQALALRMQRPLVAQRMRSLARVVASFQSIHEAMQSVAQQPADLIIWYAPELQANNAAEMTQQLRAVEKSLEAKHAAVVYRYSGSSVIKAFDQSDVLTLREPADDEALVSWLEAMSSATLPSFGQALKEPPAPDFQMLTEEPTPRRYDDAALTAIAGLSPTLACECPTHIAELLMQLSSFESYSAGCVNQSPEDAQLHAYLQQVAGQARAMFEAALERVAQHEGLQIA